MRSNFIYSFSRAPVAIGSFVIASGLILFAIAAPLFRPIPPMILRR